MAEIHELQPVDLREAWPDEARDFTPWLAERLHLLGKELNLDLELVGTERVLPGAGRVDILAKQVCSSAMVAIENQLDRSDDEHLLALQGYAASAEADIAIWVAADFSLYHRSIVEWLNRSDTIRVYAVKGLAYRVADALVADFRLAVGPHRSRTSSAAVGSSAWYADFYQPLVEELRRSGLSRGGYTGSYRSFETGYTGTDYATQLDEDEAHAFLETHGEDKKEVYQALERHRAAIDARLEGEKVCWNGGKEGTYWFGVKKEAPIASVDKDPEPVRRWMACKLLRLQDAAQPYLEQVMQELGRERDTGAEDSE